MFSGILLAVIVAGASALGLFIAAASGRLSGKILGMTLLQASAVVFLLGIESILSLFMPGAGGQVHPVPAIYLLTVIAVLSGYTLFGAKLTSRLRKHHGTDEECKVMD